MSRYRNYVSAIVAAGSLLAGSSIAQMTPSERGDVEQLRKPLERFSGRVTIRARDGASKEVQVVVRNWIIDNRRKIARFPEQGFLVVQLRGGEVVTTIDGERRERKSDEFWTVPAGSTMSIETGDDSATLQTIAIRNP